jgi:hypothetical protein
VGLRSTVFSGSGSGFTPHSTVTQRLVQPDGTRYGGTYAQTSTAGRAGGVQWSWTRAAGDQFGRYTLVSVDVSGVRVRTSFTLVRGTLRSASPPSLSGTPRVGMSLAASTGTWSRAGVTLTYRWLRAGAVMSGQTGSTYTLRPADRGATISVRVRATKSGWLPATSTSASTAPVSTGLMVCPDQPRPTGRAREGRTLVATALGCTSPAGVGYHYRWLRGGRKIRGATQARYTLTPADVGLDVSVRVHAVLHGYEGVVRTSPARRVAP